MNAPYYQDDLVTLYHGDCREVTAWLAADVLVTDPPYGIGYKSTMNRDRRNSNPGHAIAADCDTEVRDAALSAWGDKPALVFGKWTASRPAATRARLIWDKTPCGFMGDWSLPWGSAEEEIYVLGKGFVGKREANIIRCPMLNSGDRNRPNHPTPKPVSLMETLIAKCPPGLVADPFSGSGPTLVAAKASGRSAIGVELDERYCELTANRLAQDAFNFGESA
jgi:DNA modification methylase